MQIPHLAGEQTTVQKGQGLPPTTCLLVTGTSPEHWPADSEARVTFDLCQQMRKYYCCFIAYGDQVKEELMPAEDLEQQ